MDAERIARALAAAGGWRLAVALVVLAAGAVAYLRSGAEAAGPLELSGPGLASTPRPAIGGAGDGSRGPGEPGGGERAPRASSPGQRVVVQVAGAVRRPGVYRVGASGRLIDAVERAGGLTRDADLTQVNLAAKLQDGQAITVPGRAAASGGTQARGAAGGSGAAGGGSDPASAAATGAGGKISVNEATQAELEELNGVGPATASAIVELRTQLGGFKRLEQLDDVPGIGEKRLASLVEQLTL